MEKRKAGLCLILLSLVLLASGIVGYLYTSRLFIGQIEGEKYFEAWHIHGEDDYYLWHNITLGKALNLSISFSFEETSKLPMDFYVMSSQQFDCWKNGSTKNSLMAVTNTYTQNINFNPKNNDTYYFIIDNKAYNTSKTVSVKSSSTSTIYLIDYSEPVKWLITAAIGMIAFLASHLTLRNPINNLLRRALESIRIKSIQNQGGDQTKQEESQIRQRTIKFQIIMLWVSIVAPTLLLLAILASKLPAIWEIPTELNPIVLDLLFRIFLYFFFSIFLPLSLCIFLGFLLFNIVLDTDKWLLQNKVGIKQNQEFEIQAFKYSFRHLTSPTAIVCYLVALILLSTGYLLQNIGFSFYIIGVTFLAIPFGQSMFASAEEASKKFDLDLIPELKKTRIFALNSTFISFWILAGILILIKTLIPSTITLGYELFLNSSPHPLKTEIFSFTPTTSQANAMIESVFSSVFLGTAVFFAVFLTIEYYLLPAFKNKKFGSLVFPVISTVFSTATGSLLVYVISPGSLTNPFVQFMLPISSFIASYFTKKAFDDLKIDVLGG